MSNFASPCSEYEVICICGGSGFPLGTASAARITIIGKALQGAALRFRLLHCGPSPVAINTQKSGIYEGIPFEYTSCVRRPQSRAVRLLVYLWAVVGLTAKLVRLWPVRRSVLIYLYLMEGPINLYIGSLCKVLRLPVMQDFCEWPPGEPSCSRFTHWLYKKRIFTLATGALVISGAIEDRVGKRSSLVNPRLLIHRTPAIVDCQRFGIVSPCLGKSDQQVPNFVYCGGAWLKDILFLIRAFAFVRKSGYQCRLTLVGGYAEERRSMILKYAQERGLSVEDVTLLGCVDECTLKMCYKTASALLAPLWDDDRSVTRLPNKISEYLASGRPVISGRIGDITNILTDNVNAFLGRPGSERDFADKMITILRDPVYAERVGAAGQQACTTHLDYRSHISGLANFVLNCIHQYNARRIDAEGDSSNARQLSLS
jgi:glycosyltransferase involved in cell wall biosynthesis